MKVKEAPNLAAGNTRLLILLIVHKYSTVQNITVQYSTVQYSTPTWQYSLSTTSAVICLLLAVPVPRPRLDTLSVCRKWRLGPCTKQLVLLLVPQID